MKKPLLLLLTAIIALNFIFPGTVLAVNEQFDNPDDDVISQNESKEDLLNEELPDAPNPTGTSYILYDAQSDTVLMGREIDTQINPATCTIVMTVLVALENLDLDDTITIDQSMYIGIPEGFETLGLTEGEEVTVKDMIFGALLQSANDACLALAIKVSGSEAAFCTLMNAKAQELGCTNTNFLSCYGITNGGATNHSSARDMAIILNECCEHEDFKDIATTFQHTMNPTNLYPDSRTISNANRFISTQEYSYDYYIGGKTGYAEGAGYTQVAASEKNGRRLVTVLLGATNNETRYRDTIDLFEYGYSAFTTVMIEPSEFTPVYNETINQINGALLDTKLGVMSAEMEFSSYLTTTSYRTAAGSSNSVDLSAVMIDVNADDQNFEIPILKTYSDGKTYIVGVLHLEIAIKDHVVSVNPTKTTPWTRIKNVLITFAGVVVLALILIIALMIFRKHRIRRYDEEFRNKNKML
ncbi:D-alanyl-D-alanine carboxypeptidase [Oscillospiraceae bacterium]|nr:D-alanyl-D-alanine carboxypeptidase [Oscillospiraceae bacterium]